MATGSSEEYLASLGFDTSDVDKAVNQTVTLLGHLGNQFDSVSGKAERAATNLSKSSKSTTTATVSGTRALSDRDRQLEVSSKQNALYNQYLFDQEKALTGVTGSLISQRYALYDVATTYGAISAALLLADGYAIQLAGDFQRSFTDVERTTDAAGAGLGRLRDELVQLSTQGPITFQELSRIATLGNQLGVSSGGIADFTRVVSQFSTATGIAADASAQAFGRIGNVLGIGADQYGNLASSIVYVGRTSAATEQQIISLTERLGATATRAGLTADEVVGLSGALASFAVAPERAQGVFETYFNKLNSAVASGGEALDNFGVVAGKTGAEVAAMVRGGQGLDLLLSILRRLENAGTVDTTRALEALGLTGLRVNEVLPRLAGGVDQLEDSLANSAQAWRENAELQRQYELITDDLNSRVMELVNSVNALIEAASGGQAEGIADLLKGLIDITNGAREFVETPLGQRFAELTILAIALVGGVLALRSAQALATASTYALITAQQSLGATSGLTGIRGLVSALFGYTTVANGATVSTLTLTTAIKALAKATLILAAADFAIRLVTDFDGLSKEVNDATGGVFGFQQALDRAGTSLATVGDLTFGVENGMLRIGDASYSAADALLASTGPLGAVVALIQAFNNETDQQQTGRRSRGGSFGIPEPQEVEESTAATEDFSSALDQVGRSGGGAAKQVRTLLDYANDLGSVISRAFDIRFGGQQAFDQITDGWSKIRESVASVNDEIAKYQAEMLQLTSDRSIREYWLSVAENYGDTLRAGQLRAELADIDLKLAASTKGLSTAQAKGSRTLTANTEAGAENRREILGLVSSYQDYVTALASAGTPQAELQAITSQLRQDFIAQANQLGYNSAELEVYARGFDDVGTAIQRVPRNITVAFNGDPALLAANEFMAKLAQSVGGGVSVPVNVDYSKASRGAAIQSMIDLLLARQGAALNIGTKETTAAQIQRLRDQLNSGSYRSGTSWTGSGNPWDVAGVVHNRERVLNETGSRMVSSQFVNAANQGRNPWQYAPAGGGAMKMPSTLTVELSPIDRDLLAQGKEVTVIVAGPSLERTTSAVSADDSRRGGG